MKKLPALLALLAVTAWVGSLWAIGYLAAPVLFFSQPDRQLAGMLAGEMFNRVALLGLVCGGYLLVYGLMTSGAAVWRQATFRLVLAMLLLTLVTHFGIQPMMNALKAQALPAEVMHSEFARQFGMLHGLSSILYLLQSLLGAALVVYANRLNRPPV
ncbi:MAG: DUF4149 domain-containing protein [Nitrosomonadales bacterium]|nr:DUF4149 domain-containing protein [Nitrosomonadales bacterium]